MIVFRRIWNCWRAEACWIWSGSKGTAEHILVHLDNRAHLLNWAFEKKLVFLISAPFTRVPQCFSFFIFIFWSHNLMDLKGRDPTQQWKMKRFIYEVCSIEAEKYVVNLRVRWIVKGKGRGNIWLSYCIHTHFKDLIHWINRYLSIDWQVLGHPLQKHQNSCFFLKQTKPNKPLEACPLLAKSI